MWLALLRAEITLGVPPITDPHSSAEQGDAVLRREEVCRGVALVPNRMGLERAPGSRFQRLMAPAKPCRADPDDRAHPAQVATACSSALSLASHWGHWFTSADVDVRSDQRMRNGLRPSAGPIPVGFCPGPFGPSLWRPRSSKGTSRFGLLLWSSRMIRLAVARSFPRIRPVSPRQSALFRTAAAWKPLHRPWFGGGHGKKWSPLDHQSAGAIRSGVSADGTTPERMATAVSP